MGLGLIGRVIAWDLYERATGRELLLVDVNESALREVSARLRGSRTVRVDASDVDALSKAIEDVDVVVGALPGKLGKSTWLAAIEAGVDLVDVSYSPEDPLTLNVQAREAGITLVPDAGVAPGLSNMLAGRAYARLEGRVDDLVIYVGAIPERPTTPLGYTITWSPEDLIEEYTRPARVIREGRVVSLPALSDVEVVEVEGVGRLEAFLTDGLRTMLRTLKGVRRMEEKTLRWPGHAERVTLLKDLGLFDARPIEVGGVEVSPSALLAELFRRRLAGDSRDLVVLLVRARGVTPEGVVEVEYRVVDRYDDSSGLTATARTTAFTATAVADLLADGRVPGPGVVPPEALGMDEGLMGHVADWLARRGILIQERVTTEGRLG
ncbi:MAG: saccharopine dehydrogenase C-terminal domain-containing protein [Candidatus Korarchaeota archaeon]|nr:saccharopine dehydrogenase C-terminal domain-containing protein [Candidatus Korarchaeota archaeon]